MSVSSKVLRKTFIYNKNKSGSRMNPCGVQATSKEIEL